MSQIKSVVSYINTTLQANSFAGKPFQKGRFSGVAELVKKVTGDDETSFTIPVLLDDDGDSGTEISINDKYPFEIYHRIKNQTTGEAENEDTFGDGDNKIITFDMVLILFSDRFINEIEASEYLTALMLDIPRTINATNVTGSQWSKCEINLTDNNLDKSDVLAQEYGRDDFNIPQNYIALQFGYEVQLTFEAGCFTLC